MKLKPEPFRLGPWVCLLMLGCYLHFESHVHFHWMMCTPAILLPLGLWRLRLELGWIWTLSFGLLCIGAGCALAKFRHPPSLPKGDIEGFFRIKEDGKLRGSRLRYAAHDLAAESDVTLLLDTTEVLSPGNVVQVEGWNSGFADAFYPYQYNEVRFAQIRGVAGKIYGNEVRVLDTCSKLSARQRLLKRLEEWPVSTRTKGFYSAMLLGDKSEIDSEDKTAFATSGLVHVLAVSGLHVGLIALFLEKLTSLLKRIGLFKTRWLQLVLVLCGIWGFVWLSGMGVSVVRAGLLFTMVQIARLTGRKGVTAEAVWLAAAVLVCFNPITIFDLGFQLSFAAVFGIVYGHSIVQAKLKGLNLSKLTRFILSSASVSFWAQWGTSAITLYHFHQFPSYFLLSNVLFLPFIPLLLILGILLMVMDASGFSFSWVWNLTDTLVEWFFTGVTWLADLPGALISSIYISMLMAIAIAVGFILVIVSFRKRWKYVLVVALLLPLVFLPAEIENGIWIHQIKNTPAVEVQKGEVSMLYSPETEVLNRLIYKSAKWRESRGVDSVQFRHLSLPIPIVDSSFYTNDAELLVFE